MDSNSSENSKKRLFPNEDASEPEKKRPSKLKKPAAKPTLGISKVSKIESLGGHDIFPDVQEGPATEDRRKVSETTAIRQRMREPFDGLPRDKKDHTQAEFGRACGTFEGRSMKPAVGDDKTACWKLKGMTCVLHHHQLFGAAAMRQLEKGGVEFRGGILADQMGYGSKFSSADNVPAC